MPSISVQPHTTVLRCHKGRVKVWQAAATCLGAVVAWGACLLRTTGGGRGVTCVCMLPSMEPLQPLHTSWPCVPTPTHSAGTPLQDVEVEPGNPHLFWSASEDGCVRQYDARDLRRAASFASPNVLLSVASRGSSGGGGRAGGSAAHLRPVELKALDINPAAPHLLAVGCGDPYVRVYDRRKLALSGPEAAAGAPAEPLLALAPPHMDLLGGSGGGGGAAGSGGRRGGGRQLHATHVCFSGRGDRLLASYHADHAYCFDVTAAGSVAAAFAAPPPSRCTAGAAAEGAAPGPPAPGLPEGAERHRLTGNAALFENRSSAAVAAFGAALREAPRVAALYVQRADALLARGWAGDAAFALRDCDAALALKPRNKRALLRRIQAFKALGQPRVGVCVCGGGAGWRFSANAGGGQGGGLVARACSHSLLRCCWVAASPHLTTC